MAKLSLDLNKEVSLGNVSRGKMPTKTTINLVPKKESIFSTRKGITTVIIGSIIALVLAIVLIVIPVIKMVNANAKVKQLSEELEATNNEIAQMAGIEEEYAHYTYEDMTPDEMNRVDRVKVMKLVQDTLISGGVARSWTLSENMMTFDVSGATLAELNQIASRLEQEPIVERCVINTANKGGNADTSGVAVSFEIYLVKPTDGDAQAGAEVAETQTTTTETTAEGSDE